MVNFMGSTNTKYMTCFTIALKQPIAANSAAEMVGDGGARMSITTLDSVEK